MIHMRIYAPPIKDFKKFLLRTSFQNSFRPSICKNTQFTPLPPGHTCTSCPNINIPLRWFFFRWIRRQSRLCTMESRSWKEKSSGWSRHFLRYFRARNRLFIPSFPPFSTEQRARYRAYPPPEGDGFVSSRLLLTDFFLNGWFAGPMRGEKTKGIRGWKPSFRPRSNV